MGIIQRQSVKQSIINYVATGIAAISTLFIYPLDKEIYGYALFILGTATFLYPFTSVGINTLTVRFFPTFQNKEQQHHGFLGILLLSAIVLFGLFVLVFSLFEEHIYHGLALLKFNSELIRSNVQLILGLTLLITFINILTSFTSNFMRTVVPAIFNNLWFKVALPIIVLLYAYSSLSQQSFGWSILGYHFIGLVGLTGYLIYHGELALRIRRSFVSRQLLSRMANYALYGSLGMIGGILAFRIDLFMVPTLLGLNIAGIYGIAQFIGSSIEMPTRAMISITSPVIAQAWKKNDLQEIAAIYTKSSLNLFLVGLLVFLGLWAILEDLFRLTGDFDSLIQGKYVVLFAALSKLVDMVTSVNSQIIGHSPFYRFNFFSVIILGLSNVLLNYWLIPIMGITGAALATFISITLFNLSRLMFIWFKFGLHPFTLPTLYLLLLGLLLFSLTFWLPDLGHPLINIPVKGGLLVFLYLWIVLYFNFSEDFTTLVFDFWEKIRQKLG